VALVAIALFIAWRSGAFGGRDQRVVAEDATATPGRAA
jgi:hypothetical protein